MFASKESLDSLIKEAEQKGESTPLTPEEYDMLITGKFYSTSENLL